MAIYTRVAGVWKNNNYVYTRVAGVWKQVSLAYIRVSGAWKTLFTNEYVYTFSANATNVDFATLIGAANVAKYTKFKIIVNSGVTISGSNGANGANSTAQGRSDCTGAGANTAARVSGSNTRTCNSETKSGIYTATGNFYYSSNGGAGAGGSVALNLSGMSGKTVTIVNNGTIRGGNGGAGGTGASTPFSSIGRHSAIINCGLNGANGAGGVGINNGTNTVTVTGNAAINGVNGSQTNYGYRSGGGCTCCCGGCG